MLSTRSQTIAIDYTKLFISDGFIRLMLFVLRMIKTDKYVIGAKPTQIVNYHLCYILQLCVIWCGHTW